MLHSPLFRSELVADNTFQFDAIPTCIKHPFITIGSNEELCNVLKFVQNSANALYFEQYKYFNFTTTLTKYDSHSIDNIGIDISLCTQIMQHISKYIKTLHVGIYAASNHTANSCLWDHLFSVIIDMCLHHQLHGLDLKLKRFPVSEYESFNQFYCDLFSLNNAYHCNPVTHCWTMTFVLIVDHNLIQYWIRNHTQWNQFATCLTNTSIIGHLTLRLEVLLFDDSIQRKISQLFECASQNPYIVELTLTLRISSQFMHHTSSVQLFHQETSRQLISQSIQSSIIQCVANKTISHHFTPTTHKRCYIDQNEMEFLGNDFEIRIDAHNAHPSWRHHLIAVDPVFLDGLFQAISNNDNVSLYSLYLNECCWDTKSTQSLCNLITDKCHCVEQLSLSGPIYDSRKYLIHENDFAVLVDGVVADDCHIRRFSFGNVGNTDVFVKSVTHLIENCTGFMEYIGLEFNKLALSKEQCCSVVDAFFNHLMRLYTYQKDLHQTLKDIDCLDEDVLPFIVEYCRSNGFVVDISRVEYRTSYMGYYYYLKMFQFVSKMNTNDTNDEYLKETFEHYLSSVLCGENVSVDVMFNFQSLSWTWRGTGRGLPPNLFDE
eukprot:310009_1